MNNINKIINPFFVFVFGLSGLLLQYIGQGFEKIGLSGILLLVGVTVIKLIWGFKKNQKSRLKINVMSILISISFLVIARYLGASVFIKFNNISNHNIQKIELIYMGDHLGSHLFSPVNSNITITEISDLNTSESKWTRINKFEHSFFALKIDTTSNIIKFNNYDFSPRFEEIIIDQNNNGNVIGKLKTK